MNWDTISKDVSNVVSALAPVVEAALPTEAAAIALGIKIVQGAMAAEPAAVALFEQIKNGTPATPTQLADFSAQYEAAYQQLNNDINEKLSSLTI